MRSGSQRPETTREGFGTYAEDGAGTLFCNYSFAFQTSLLSVLPSLLPSLVPSLVPTGLPAGKRNLMFGADTALTE